MYATHIKHISILQNLRKQAVAAKILVMYRLLGVFYATKKGLYLFAQHLQYQYFSWKKKHLKLVIASAFCVAFLLRIKVEFCSKILEYFKLYLMPTPEAWKEAWWLYTTKLSSTRSKKKFQQVLEITLVGLGKVERWNMVVKSIKFRNNRIWNSKTSTTSRSRKTSRAE